MNRQDDLMLWLQNWYHQNCDGDWEHSNGVQIGNLSNPGWSIKIDIEETELQGKQFKQVFIERSENDWLFCDKRDGFFESNCGPFNLPEVLQIFRDWATEHGG